MYQYVNVQSIISTALPDRKQRKRPSAEEWPNRTESIQTTRRSSAAEKLSTDAWDSCVTLRNRLMKPDTQDSQHRNRLSEARHTGLPTLHDSVQTKF